MTTTTLPDKPSELIRLALDDLRQCEDDPRYAVSMGEWHNGHLNRGFIRGWNR